MRKYNYLFLFLLFILIIGCKKNKTSIYSFENNIWTVNDSVSLVFDVSDTSKTYNLSLFFRNTLDYEYRNLYLFVQTSWLDSLIKIDTLQYPISDKYGSWFGRGLGNTRDNYFLFEANRQFTKLGLYEIKLIHGMRNENLIGCSKFGFKVRKNE